MTFEERADFLMQAIESHDRQIGELHEAIAKTNAAIDKLLAVTNDDASAIRSLARIAKAHEHRISQIEGDRSDQG